MVSGSATQYFKCPSLVLAALFVLGSIPHVQADDQSEFTGLLAGKWLAVAEESSGTRMKKADVKTMEKTLQIDGEKFVLSWSGKTMTGTIEIMPDESPVAIDLSGKLPTGKNAVLRGICEVNDDTLRLCYVIDVGDTGIERPKEFETEEGTRHSCVTYERQEIEGSGWKFYDVNNKGIDPDRAIIVARDGSLVCQGKVGGYCLASLQEYSEFNFTVEFQYQTQKVTGGPYVSVASTLPDPKAKEWFQQIPFGIEVKLAPANVGELILPKPDFKVELPLGQLRDQRKIVALRKPELKNGDWNGLEITCDQHKNVTVKINGTTVNAVAKAENTTGHIVIFPQNAEMRFRNPIVVLGEEQTPLSFETVQ